MIKKDIIKRILDGIRAEVTLWHDPSTANKIIDDIEKRFGLDVKDNKFPVQIDSSINASKLVFRDSKNYEVTGKITNIDPEFVKGIIKEKPIHKTHGSKISEYQRERHKVAKKLKENHPDWDYKKVCLSKATEIIRKEKNVSQAEFTDKLDPIITKTDGANLLNEIHNGSIEKELARFKPHKLMSDYRKLRTIYHINCGMKLEDALKRAQKDWLANWKKESRTKEPEKEVKQKKDIWRKNPEKIKSDNDYMEKSIPIVEEPKNKCAYCLENDAVEDSDLCRNCKDGMEQFNGQQPRLTRE